ncbi:MAG TPA: hypothetical protein VH189_07795, partial [Rhizomicrobium sp.]|nr:hypothetical protein [Rhizomicrobium sp.]
MMNRRHFARTAAAAPLALAAGQALAQTIPQPGAAGPSLAAPPTTGANAVRQIVERLSTEPFARPLEFQRNRQAAKLRPFALTDVRLGDGPFQDMHRWNAAYMKRLSPDSLLHAFRVNAGIPSQA